MIKLATTLKSLAAAAAAGLVLTASAFAAPSVGEPAPAFTGMTSSGEEISLSQFAGQKVVLEWTNHKCPYVVKHYDTGNMQAMQKEMAGEGVVWISVISSAPGKQGHVSAEEANALSTSRGAEPAYVLLDESGDIGRAYEAKTTPHMFLIDTDGTLRYMGAIDDKPTTRKSSVEGAKNYVRQAFAEVKAGQDVSEPSTKPYGCSVKY